MTTQHTPGPWKARPSDTNPARVWITQDAPPNTKAVPFIAQCAEGNPQAEANARLIATAPEMLAALQAIHAALDQPVQYTGLRTPATTDVLRVDARLAREVALAAIAKATGAPHTATPTKVTVEVTGAMAEVTSCPAGVQVEIIDHDNQDNGGFPLQPSTFTPQPSPA